jgi:hypothetical protein
VLLQNGIKRKMKMKRPVRTSYLLCLGEVVRDGCDKVFKAAKSTRYKRCIFISRLTDP